MMHRIEDAELCQARGVENRNHQRAQPLRRDDKCLYGLLRNCTEPEYRGLLHEAGFKLMRVMPTESAVSVVDAVPA